jgi:regulator of replication initiation timing
MKEVLMQAVERRLETLRRAFRIEDYSIAGNNTSTVLTWVDKEIEFLSRQTEDIGENRATLDEENKKINEYNEKLGDSLRELEGIKDEKRKILETIEKLQTKKELVPYPLKLFFSRIRISLVLL